MSIEISQTVGTGIKVTVRADETKEAVESAAFFGDLPKKCSCGSTELSFTCRRPETYVYYGMKCKTCYREFLFGQTKEGDRLFPKWDDGWKTLEERKAASGGGTNQGGGNQDSRGGGTSRQQTSRPTHNAGNRNQPMEEDDIPF